MDSRQATGHLPRSFWTLAALTVTWGTLAPGLYFLFSKEATWGTLLSAFGVMALIASLSRAILMKLEARVVYRPLAMLFVVIVLVTSLFELWAAISIAPASHYPPSLVGMHAGLLLLLGVATGFQLRPSPGGG
jgi:hypothetical protein